MDNFESILLCILSKDKEIRFQGEERLSCMEQQSPELLIQSLLASLSSRSVEVSNLSAVLLRRFLPSMFESLSAPVKDQIKSSLLSQLASRELAFQRKIADILIEFADLDNWTASLIEYARLWTSSDSEVLKQLAMYTLSLIADRLPIEETVGLLIDLTWKSMHDPSVPVALSALSAFYSLLSATDHPHPFLPMISKTLDVLRDNYAGAIDDVLASVADATLKHPRIWETKQEELIQVLNMCINGPSVSTRSLAAELINLIIRKGSDFLHENTVKEILTLGFILLTELSHPFDIDLWNSEVEEKLGTSSFELGKLILVNVACYIERAAVHTIQLIKAHLAANHWARQHSGILAIGMVSDGYASDLKPMLPEIFEFLVGFGCSANPRLRWASLVAVSYLCKEFKCYIASHFSSQVMHIVLTCLDPANYMKVSAQAASTLRQYSENLLKKQNLKKEALFSYASQFLPFYLELLGNDKILKDIIDSLNVIAAVMDDCILPYYATFVPGLMAIACSSHKIDVRSAAISCVSSMPITEDQAISIVQQFIHIKQGLEFGSELHLAILRAIPVLTLSMHTQIYNCLDVFVPEMLQMAQTNVQVCFTDAETNNTSYSNVDVFDVDLRGLGRKQLIIDSNAMNEKLTALLCINKMVKSLGTRYEKYIFCTLDAVLPSLTYLLSSKVQKYAAKITGRAIRCCSGKLEVFFKLMAVWVDIIPSCTRQSDLKNILKAVLFTLKEIDCVACISLAQAYALVDIVSNQAKTNSSDQVLNLIIDIIEVLLEAFRKDFIGVFYEIVAPRLGDILYASSSPESLLIYALCLISKFLEHIGDVSTPIITKLVELCYHLDVNVRHNAAYAIGLASQMADFNAFLQFKDSAVAGLRSILALPTARDECLECTECAAFAIGKIAIRFDNTIVCDWLGWMPFKTDQDEARNSLKMMADNIEILKNWQREIGFVWTEISKLDSKFVEEEAVFKIQQVINR